MYSSGGSLADDVDNPTRCTLGEEKSLRGLEFYTDLIHRYQVMPTPTELANLGMGIHCYVYRGAISYVCFRDLGNTSIEN